MLISNNESARGTSIIGRASRRQPIDASSIFARPPPPVLLPPAAAAAALPAGCWLCGGAAAAAPPPPSSSFLLLLLRPAPRPPARRRSICFIDAKLHYLLKPAILSIKRLFPSEHRS